MRGLPIPMGLGAGLGLPGILLLLLLYFGPQLCSGSSGGIGNPFQEIPQADPPAAAPIPRSADPDASTVDFVSFVLDDAQVFWDEQFAEAGQQYRDAQLVLFIETTQSGCGFASSATGPFYCSLDQTAYMDLDFFDDLHRRFGAPGDFAQAYVIAHEIAHHVQNVTGISDEVRSRAQDNPDEANELSVRQELQADCLAGVWGYSTNQRGLLESGDISEALRAAAAIGDDRIQQQSAGRIDPDTWTHGSSEQRETWFRRGFETGDPSTCDTFAGKI
jgi:predicted metalloprotease